LGREINRKYKIDEKDEEKKRIKMKRILRK
jgi:hypothetical protein